MWEPEGARGPKGGQDRAQPGAQPGHTEHPAPALGREPGASPSAVKSRDFKARHQVFRGKSQACRCCDNQARTAAVSLCASLDRAAQNDMSHVTKHPLDPIKSRLLSLRHR